MELAAWRQGVTNDDSVITFFSEEFSSMLQTPHMIHVHHYSFQVSLIYQGKLTELIETLYGDEGDGGRGGGGEGREREREKMCSTDSENTNK